MKGRAITDTKFFMLYNKTGWNYTIFSGIDVETVTELMHLRQLCQSILKPVCQQHHRIFAFFKAIHYECSYNVIIFTSMMK